MENLPIDILEDILFRLSVELALQAKHVCTTWEAILGSKFSDYDYMMAKIHQTPGVSFQFDARHYDSKMSAILQAEAGQDFFISYSYDDLFESFDSMGLQENLLNGIHAYGSRKRSAVQQRGIVPFFQGLDEIKLAQNGRDLRIDELLGLPTQKPQSSIVKNEVSHSSQCHKHIFRDRKRRINRRKDVWKRKL